MHSPGLARLGYTAADERRVRELGGDADFEKPEDLRRVLDRCKYLEDWRANYRAQSVRSSLRTAKITCLDGALLAYGLLELFFPKTQRCLLAIHRRDPKTDEECGHCAALYCGKEGRYGAFSKSSFEGLGHLDAVFADASSLARTYAAAYVRMGFEPLYFGVTTLERAAPDLDWRFSEDSLHEISDRLLATYEYGFSVG